jgi:hypothetical protein
MSLDYQPTGKPQLQPKKLFDVNVTLQKIEKNRSEAFHSVVAKLLFVATRARIDILLVVSVLCSRVSLSTVDDKLKLRRLLEYLKGTMNLEYVLAAEFLTHVQSWVDASYAVHPDMKSHTGGVSSFGVGGLLANSTNTKNPTEAGLVGACDYLPHTVWIKLFMEAQGHKISQCTLEQDNESAIRLEQNGRSSAGTNS